MFFFFIYISRADLIFSETAVYPGLMESIDAKDYSNGLKWSGIINKCIRRATKSLQ